MPLSHHLETNLKNKSFLFKIRISLLIRIGLISISLAFSLSLLLGLQSRFILGYWGKMLFVGTFLFFLLILLVIISMAMSPVSRPRLAHIIAIFAAEKYKENARRESTFRMVNVLAYSALFAIFIGFLGYIFLKWHSERKAARKMLLYDKELQSSLKILFIMTNDLEGLTSEVSPDIDLKLQQEKLCQIKKLVESIKAEKGAVEKSLSLLGSDYPLHAPARAIIADVESQLHSYRRIFGSLEDSSKYFHSYRVFKSTYYYTMLNEDIRRQIPRIDKSPFFTYFEINGKNRLVLIDTGADANFISPHAVPDDIFIDHSISAKCTVTNGDTFLIPGKAMQVPIKFEGKVYYIDAFILKKLTRRPCD